GGFLDAIAGGTTPGDALPKLGAFRDPVADEPLSARRIVDNFNLAATRAEAGTLSAGSLAEIRTRAERHLINRADSAEVVADRVIELLTNVDPNLLSYLTFDEAKRVLVEPPPAELPEQVAEELRRWA